MPKFVIALCFAQVVPHQGPIGGFRHCKGFWPLRQVGHVKAHVVGFGQVIQVDVVELEQVVHFELSNGRHGADDEGRRIQYEEKVVECALLLFV